MPLGILALVVVAGVIFFGLAHRVLDRMRLTDAQALVFIALMIGGSFIDVPLTSGAVTTSINVGGGIVPLALAVYLLFKAGTTWEWVRALLAAVGTAAILLVISAFTDFGPHSGRGIIDPLWLVAIVGGLSAYVLGRSRRGAFIAGTLGVILLNLYRAVQANVQGFASTVAIGGAGTFDAVVFAGLFGVVLAELIGESRERLQGGPVTNGDRPLALRKDEGVFDENKEETSEELTLGNEQDKRGQDDE